MLLPRSAISLLVILDIFGNVKANGPTQDNNSIEKDKDKDANECEGQLILQSVYGTFLKVHDDEWKATLEQGTAKEWERWIIEKAKGGDNKVTLKALHSHDKYLRANGDGSVDLNNRAGDWETWTVKTNDDGSCSFKSVHGLWLSSKDGVVKAILTRETTEHFWPARWTVFKDDNSTDLKTITGNRTLKSFRGTFLRWYQNEMKVEMVRGPANASEYWEIEDKENGKVVIKMIHSPLPARFLRADHNGYVDITQHVDQSKDSVEWKPFKNDNGSWSFRSGNFQWLNAKDDGTLKTVIDRDIWDNFWLEDEPKPTPSTPDTTSSG